MPTLQLAKGNLDASFNAAVTSIRDAFHKHGFEIYRDTMVDEIAEIVPNDQSALLQIGMLIDASGYRIVPLTQGSHYSENPPIIIGECGYEKLELFALEWAEYWDNVTKARYLQSIPSITSGKVQIIPLLEILKKLKANPTCLYDKLAFFHTAHKVDPLDTKSGTDPNLIYEPLTSAGWDNVFQKIITRKAPGSRTAQDKYFLPNRSIADGNQLAIYTGYASIASALGKIFDPSAFWNPGTNQATETRKVYSKATVHLCPEMAVIDADANDYVYIFVKTDTERGAMVRIPHAPTVKRTRAESDEDVDRDVTRIAAKQTFGCTLTNPWKIYKWKFTAP
jgi:hypothetical protein